MEQPRNLLRMNLLTYLNIMVWQVRSIQINAKFPVTPLFKHIKMKTLNMHKNVCVGLFVGLKSNQINKYSKKFNFCYPKSDPQRFGAFWVFVVILNWFGRKWWSIWFICIIFQISIIYERQLSTILPQI